MMRLIFILFFITTFQTITAQEDILIKLDKKDSIHSHREEKIYKSNQVTSEVHNLLFRNIYHSKSVNEEIGFKKEIERLIPFDNKIIDTIIFIQVNTFGESVYDSSIRSNKTEKFLSTKIHHNTRTQIIRNRYLTLKTGQNFSPYKAYEEARLMRSSGIFHDVSVIPIISSKDTQHITLIYRIQDVFPYGIGLDFNSLNNFGIILENINIGGWNHRLKVDQRLRLNDTNQFYGIGIQYTIPNIIKKSFIDAYGLYSNFSLENTLEYGLVREFVKPEFRWAGGVIASLKDGQVYDRDSVLRNHNHIASSVWISHAIPFKSTKMTVNSIIGGLSYSSRYYFTQPKLDSLEPYKFSNSYFILSSIGYSRIRFTQDRLFNGFGRTEDIPLGFSINGLYGIDYNQATNRNYYGGQFLAQYHTGMGYYINLSTKLGLYTDGKNPSQGVFDFNLQNVSKAYKFGNFRLRNFFKLRTTIGIDQDRLISLNNYEGIRGIRNQQYVGKSRFTSSFQSNLFIPTSILGFRCSLFGLIEVAKIQSSLSNFFETPLLSGFTMGLAIKNENLIFDVIQFQYGYYPSTINVNSHGFSISSIIPFNFQKLDISRPRTIQYE